MKVQYRAIEGTNTKTRRLAYLTAILFILRQNGLSELLLVHRTKTWSSDHQIDLSNYYVHTGEITSTRKNSASLHYLDLAVRLKLIVPLSGMYQITRIGSVLTKLIETYEQNANPFFLNSVEKIFYTYCLLKADADILLTVVDNLLIQEEPSIALLQQNFKENFLKRLDNKAISVTDRRVKQQLRDRRIKIETEWEHPERYAEHIVPPRLNWLLDLGFLQSIPFSQHRFLFTEEGEGFLSALPCFGPTHMRDVTDQWLDIDYWKVVTKVIAEIEAPVDWREVESEKQYDLMRTLLTEAFSVFHYSLVPRISLSQIMLYLSIRFLLDYRIITGPVVLTQWFSSARIMDGRQYEVRLSPRENESYLIIM